jgi:hypothetical protein
MVAFGIADELYKMKMEKENMDKVLDEKIKMLSGLLE